MTPQRIQLSRAKGWRKPEDVVVVARPSKWGNPFRVGDRVSVHGYTADGLIFESTMRLTLDNVLELYRDEIQMRIAPESDGAHPDDIAATEQWRSDLDGLRGKDLACWCPLDQPCHADILLELANG